MAALIIAGFPGCGKTTYYNNWSLYSSCNKYRQNGKGMIGERIMDVVTDNFKWFYSDHGKTDIKIPWFPSNYTKSIMKYIETEDIIFVSADKETLDILTENKIPYILVYPDRSLKSAWIRRLLENAVTDQESVDICNLHETWDKQIDDMENDSSPHKYILDGNDTLPYISVTLMRKIMNETIMGI